MCFHPSSTCKNTFSGCFSKTSRSTVQSWTPNKKGVISQKIGGPTWWPRLERRRKKLPFEFAVRWRKLNPNGVTARPARRTSSLGRLLREITPEIDEEGSSSFSQHLDPDRPWADGFDDYYDSRPEMFPKGVSMVTWHAWDGFLHGVLWLGIVLPFLPRPFRTFSAGGITISEGHVPCTTAPPSMVIEDDDDPVVKDDAEGSWDCFLDDAADNYEPDVSVE
ncbi:hypothetical protein B0H17DRAFT_1144016 [Mycena rosella]|uniref:Uncharacterized protein n=1 Tax=Mycena rosella TaxID=1033263 RepID=A0AAD7CTI3_MYCRO|nr:hypothetical protein B0H17DRAFT_1144016 [Mycena rosella]